MNVFREIEEKILNVIDGLEQDNALPAGLSRTAIAVEPPRDPDHGELACNAAMVLAKPAKMKPRDIASLIEGELSRDPDIAKVEIAGPGFLNIRLQPYYWQQKILSILEANSDFGRINLTEAPCVIIEYVSANPTGPLHVGHTRGAVFGDALANLLAFTGHDVVREYYINDGGAQVDVLARSAYLRYLEAFGKSIDFPEGTYPGDYLVPVGEALKAEYGERFLNAPESEWLPAIRAFSIDAMMSLIRGDLAALGVKMDVYSSENTLRENGAIEKSMEKLENGGLLYHGTLAPPKGKLPEDWEAREQLLFRSTNFGDDQDRPVKKSDGDWTYFAPDIAYHADKASRANQLINILGADHAGYAKRIKAATSALTNSEVPLDIKLIQLVRLLKNGEPVKMSKRAGSFITLRDVIEEVGGDVTRFHMLTRKNDAPLDFDFNKVQEHSRDNPVFYVQYAHARIASALRKASEDEGLDVRDERLHEAPLESLNDPAEMALLRKLCAYPRMVEIASKAHEPHRIAFYLYDLASLFHTLWNKGHEVPELRLIQSGNPATTRAKLALARATAIAIASGLAILGVTPLDEMR